MVMLDFERFFNGAINDAVKIAIDEVAKEACDELVLRLKKQADSIALSVIKVYDIKQMGDMIMIRVDKKNV